MYAPNGLFYIIKVIVKRYFYFTKLPIMVHRKYHFPI
jgi:hypothetical protein